MATTQPDYKPSASSGVFGSYMVTPSASLDPTVTTTSSKTTTSSIAGETTQPVSTKSTDTVITTTNKNIPIYDNYHPSANSGVFGSYTVLPTTSLSTTQTSSSSNTKIVWEFSGYRASNSSGVFGSYKVLTPIEMKVSDNNNNNIPEYLETADDWKSPGTPNGVRIIAEWKVRNTKFYVCHGSVVDFSGEALVNAANEGCLGGGGVDGAVTRAGGYKLDELRRALPIIQSKRNGMKRCETGSAVITGSGYGSGNCKLKSKYVIHAVGPNYLVRARGPKSIETCDQLLYDSYKECLIIGNKLSIKSIGFCLISAGIFRGPQSLDTVLKIGCQSIYDNIYNNCNEIYMIGYTSREMDTLLNVAPQVFGEPIKMYETNKRSQVSQLAFDTAKGLKGKLFAKLGWQKK